MIRVPVRPPASPVATTGHLEDLQRARDVDALAAREREHLARAMAEADLEHGHGQRAVERRVRRHGDDHVTIPQRFARGLRRVPLRLARRTRLGDRLGGDEVRRCDEPIPVVDLDAADARPFATGSASAVGATTRSTSGFPFRTCRRSCAARRVRRRAGHTPSPPSRTRGRGRSPGRAGTGRARTRAARGARRCASRACRSRARFRRP